MTDGIEEIIFPALSLVFLLLGVVLLTSILFSVAPYDQIAFANAEKLRAAIDETCFRNGQEVSLDKIELPQNKPSFTWLFTILPRWLVRSSGDPNYVLYYEAFPPGEATGWEVYHNFQDRMLVPVPKDFVDRTDGGNSVQTFVDNVLESHRKKEQTAVDAVTINNIMLSEGFRHDYIFTGAEFKGGPVPDADSAEEKFFAYGRWTEQSEETKIPEDGPNQFLFANYLGLKDIEKTSIKYAPCGVNSLCLKTRSGVYRIPLRYCKDIKSVQLVYDAKADVESIPKAFGVSTQSAFNAFALKSITGLSTVTSVAVSVFGGFFTETLKRHVSFKTGDFYMTSPCSVESVDDTIGIKVKKTSCAATKPYERDDEYPACTNVITYPLYKYEAKNQKLSRLGDNNYYHYTCVEQIGEKLDKLPEIEFSQSDQCVQVMITKVKKGYCWTPSPFKKSDSWWDVIIRNDLRVTSAFLYDVFLDPPIRGNTAFFSDENSQAVVLRPTETALKKGERMFEALDRKWWWGWP